MDNLRTLIRIVVFYDYLNFLQSFMYFLYGGIVTFCIMNIFEQTIRLNRQYEIDKKAKMKASMRRYKRQKKKMDEAIEKAKANRLSNR